MPTVAFICGVLTVCSGQGTVLRFCLDYPIQPSYPLIEVPVVSPFPGESTRLRVMEWLAPNGSRFDQPAPEPELLHPPPHCPHSLTSLGTSAAWHEHKERTDYGPPACLPCCPEQSSCTPASQHLVQSPPGTGWGVRGL